MFSDLAVETVAFSCRHCGHTWQADYDVRHVEDHEGESYDYFALAGQRVPAPYGPCAVGCPACGGLATNSRRVARRVVPAPRPEARDLRP